MPEAAKSGPWAWEEPAAIDALLEDLSRPLAQVGKLEEVTAGPFGRDRLRELGIDGVEFASFGTGHPTGIASDLEGLRSAEMTTRPGCLYRADEERMFVQLDVRERLPFADGSLDWVYAEHLIEHVSPLAAAQWLSEVKRILAPGGLLRLSTPDLRRYVEGYLHDDRFYRRHRRVLSMMGFGGRIPQRPAFMMNQIFYLYGHRWIYDEEELRHALGGAGFDPESFRVRAYRTGSRTDVAALDRPYRRDESIYVEVVA